MEESQILTSAANISTAELPEPRDPAAPEPAPDLEALGFASPGAQPTPESPIQDLLLYGLVPHETRRPDLAIILGVAAELEAVTAFAEGPLQVAFELLARRLRSAVDLSTRMMRPAAAEAP